MNTFLFLIVILFSIFSSAKNILPWETGDAGDIVQAPPITLKVSDVLMMNISKPQRLFNDSLQRYWFSLPNNNSVPETMYISGVLRAPELANRLNENTVVKVAQQAYNEAFSCLGSLYGSSPEFPKNGTDDEKIKWVVISHLLNPWSAWLNPSLSLNEAQQWTAVVGAFLIKFNNNNYQTQLIHDRKTLQVGSLLRHYTFIQPNGQKPQKGWPVVILFHGISNNQNPDQHPVYQALSTYAQESQMATLILKGSPQLYSNFLFTGQGALGWEPAGSGIGQANDIYVETILNLLSSQKMIDKNQIFAIGHSQGGYYMSEFIVNHPDLLKAVAIFGSGVGGLVAQISKDELKTIRRTPLYYFMGQQDNPNEAEKYLEYLDQWGYQEGKDLFFHCPKNRGHDIVPGIDYPDVIKFFRTL